MKQEQLDQFEREQIRGNAASHSYNQFIKGFIEAKREDLFAAFRMLAISDETNLMEVKRMLYAIDTLEQEILSVIDTGKLASKSLNDNHGATH